MIRSAGSVFIGQVLNINDPTVIIHSDPVKFAFFPHSYVSVITLEVQGLFHRTIHDYARTTENRYAIPEDKTT